ncbi:MAG: PQQ-binding-like beta-propeller repeat protein, partial [Thermoguttaceae bacterium]
MLEPRDIAVAAALADAPCWTVHCLVRAPARRDELLAQAQARGLGGRISASVWTGGRLPYANRLVTVLVADLDALGAAAPARDELLRVVAPLGVLATGVGGTWKYETAPVPADMDAWPQWRHDAGRSRSSLDRLAGPSEELQWEAGQVHGEFPRLVADGIVITISDSKPAVCRAYNAFTGTLLWQRTVALGNEDSKWGLYTDWMWGERAGFAGMIHRGRLFLPTDPVTVLNLVTGSDEGTLGDVGRVARIWGDSDNLVVVGLDQLAVLDAKTFAPRWKKPVGAYDLVSNGQGTLVHLDVTKEPYDLVGLSTRDGKETWRSSLAEWWVDAYKISDPFYAPRGKLSPVRIVLCAEGRLLLRSSKDLGYLVCLDPATGKERWRYDQREGAKSLKVNAKAKEPILAGADMIVLAGDRLWFPLGRNTARERMSVDFNTGKVVGATSLTCVNDFCQLSFGTARLACFKDNSWIDAASGKPVVDSWNNRVGNNQCALQVVPAYGLTYFGPKYCFCSTAGNTVRCAIDVAQTGSAFLAGKAKAEHPVEAGAGRAGPAGGEASWPCYLGSPRRLASADVALAKAPSLRWEHRIAVAPPGQWLEFVAGGDAITQPVADSTRIVVADAEGGRVVALDRATGAELWGRPVGGRVWAPPTLVGGRCLVGSDDGWATCLDLRDGAACWRCRAAPDDRLIALQGRVVSAWPVLENILVADGLAIAVAGRLQGTAAGSWAVAIDPASGEVRWSKRWTKGLPTLSPDGLVYAQTNLVTRMDPVTGYLRPADGVDAKSTGDGFRMQHQSSQPAESRRSAGVAPAPAAWGSDRLFYWGV